MKCSVCNEDVMVQKHHISYDPEMIVPLCKSCHVKLHNHGTGKTPGQISVSKTITIDESGKRICNVTVKLTTGLKESILEMVGKGNKYITTEDFIRHAILNHIQLGHHDQARKLGLSTRTCQGVIVETLVEQTEKQKPRRS